MKTVIRAEEAKVRVYKDEEVQHEGLIRRGAGGQTFWTWTRNNGLPKMAEGKKVVFLYPCNCGCWTGGSTKGSVEMINKDLDPERLVLRDVDPRYIVHWDVTSWYVIKRPQHTKAG